MYVQHFALACLLPAAVRLRRVARLTVLGGLAVVLAACGGGGGGGDSGGGGTTNRSPNASFTATPASGTAPLTVAFDGSASADPDGSIASYAWTFGDGSTATGATASHAYVTGGSFTATLQVTDNRGAVDTATRQITVQQPTGSVDVTVRDSGGLPIPSARAEAIVSGGTRSGTTGADGKVLLTEVFAGTGTLTVSRDQFVSRTIPITVAANQTAVYEVILQRVTRAAGGVLTTGVIPGTLAADGKTVEFSVQVVVVDQNSAAIDGLTAASFTLPGCTPNAAVSGPECVADATGNGSSFDVPYTVLGPGTAPPPSFEEIPGRQPPDPYAAALTFDQSESIRTNDPTDARLFSAKEFLGGLGANDLVALAAFADDGVSGNLALIPTKPVTIYPDGAPIFYQQSNVSQLLPTVDSLATLEGGATPLYHATCRLADFFSSTPPASLAGRRKATVLFTDGRNQPGVGAPNYICNSIDAAVSRSQGADVDIFTIGLSGDVDGLALGTLAADGDGVFLFAEDVSQLITIYGSLGNLLSRSLKTYKLTYRIQTDVAGTFVVDRRIRGTLTVNTGANPVNLPFVVRIFGP